MKTGAKKQKRFDFVSLQSKWMTAYPQVAEILLELISQVDVVVGTQHAQQQRLAEAARTDEEQVAACRLQTGDEHGLIHIIVVLAYEAREIRYAEGQLLDV